MNKVPVVPKLVPRAKRQDTTNATSVVFCEKSTGVAHFQAEFSADLDSTIERMASLLAMQCLVRGCEPGKYAILVPVEKSLSARLTARAKELLAEGLALANPVALSPRQKEILHAVVGNRANKEIASKLNITVRTVKFHISTLLSKFGVTNRNELARRATGILRSTNPLEGNIEPPEPVEQPTQQPLRPVAFDHSFQKARTMRFQQRVLSA